MAALDPTDTRREEARKILELRVEKAVSELVIAELASVLARQHKLLASIRIRLGVSERIALIAVILYIIKRFDLKYASVEGSLRAPLGRFYKPLAYAIELAERLRLRTLDLLHLAYIKAMKKRGIWIHTLLTADTDFKDDEEDIKRVLGIIVDIVKQD